MYAPPTLLPLDVAVATAICCQINVGEKSYFTPVCGTPVCRLVENCTLTVPSGNDLLS